MKFQLTPVPPVAPATPPSAVGKLTGTVKLDVSPPGAEVLYRRLDEQNVRPVPSASLELDAGDYVFTAHAPGYSVENKSVRIGDGTSITVKLTLIAVKPPQ